MFHNASKLATALFALTAATGCNPISELECGSLDECGIRWNEDVGRSAAYIYDEEVELVASPEFDGELVTFAMSYPAECDAPEIALRVQGIGRSLPATALASVDVFAGACGVSAGRDAADTVAGPMDADRLLSELTVDLSEALPAGMCVGNLVLGVPATGSREGGQVRVTLDHDVCGKGTPDPHRDLNARG